MLKIASFCLFFLFISPVFGALPPLEVTRTERPSLLEGQEYHGPAWLKRVGANLMSKPTTFLLTRTVIAWDQRDADLEVPRDFAIRLMESQNYDPAILPKGKINFGKLKAIMNQQSIIARYNDQANRGHLNEFQEFTADVFGTGFDPILIIFGVFIGWASRKWWHVLLGAVAGGLAYEFLGRWAMGIHGIPLVDILAIGLWILFAYLFETYRRRKKLEKNIENQK